VNAVIVRFIFRTLLIVAADFPVPIRPSVSECNLHKNRTVAARSQLSSGCMYLKPETVTSPENLISQND
jgi:hypothetical protein